MKRVIIGLMAITLCFSTNDYGFANIDEKSQMIVVFDQYVSSKEIEKILKDVGGIVSEVYDEVGVLKVEVSPNSILYLKNHPSIKYIEEDLMVKQSVQIEDYGIETTNIPVAWKSGFTGKGVKVAVIDSGIASHSDLVTVGGVSTVSYTTSFLDDNGHGTHVAGIIGARNNSIGVKGVAYESELYAVKAFNQKGEAFLSDIIEGIDWSIEHEMDIINLSLGTQVASSAFKSVLDKAYENGLLIVAAAGNDGTPDGSGDTADFPARYDSVIGVSAVDVNSKRADFSSTGPTVEISAPGVRVLSTYLEDKYAYLSGTSMAAPYVVGELALLKQAYPNLTNKEIRQVLIEHTIDLGPIGRDTFYGYGLMQASSFLESRDSVNTPIDMKVSTNNITSAPNDRVNVSAFVTYKNGQELDVTQSATWLSKNTNIAVVSKGIIDLKNYGNTTVTVTYGSQSAVIFINVPEPQNDNSLVQLEVDKSDILGKPGDFMNVKAIALYKNGERIFVTNEAIWTSSNPGIATVSKGLVELINYGSTTLNVTFEGKTASIIVNVPEPQVKPIGSNFKDVTSFFRPSVDYLVRHQITQGLTDTEFGVSKDILRADAAIWLAKELKLNTEAAPPSGFVDVPFRAIASVNALKAAGIIGGKSNTRFGANDSLTRGEVAIILQRAYELTSTSSSTKFTDVSPRYKDAVNALVENKITDGLTSTKFGVTSNITRGQLAVFIYRLSPNYDGK